MTRRRLLIAGTARVAGAAAVVALLPHGPRVSRAAVGRVKEGMTFEEVMAAVGSPPVRHVATDAPPLPGRRNDPPVAHAEWPCEGGGRLWVKYGGDGRATLVVVVGQVDGSAPRPSLLRRLWDSLRRATGL